VQRGQASAELRKENEELKATVAKLRYQVKHLVAALNSKMAE